MSQIVCKFSNPSSDTLAIGACSTDTNLETGEADNSMPNGMARYAVLLCIAFAGALLYGTSSLQVYTLWDSIVTLKGTAELGGRQIPRISADGYHYLRLAEELLRVPFSWSALTSAPLLSVYTAGVAAVCGASAVAVIPFCMVSLYMGALGAIAWWFSLVLPRRAVCVGVLVTGMFPYFFFRSAPDWYDTDPLIMLLLACIGASVTMAATRKNRRWMIGVTLLALLLLWWSWGNAAVVGVLFGGCVLLFLQHSVLYAGLLVVAGTAIALLSEQIRGWLLDHGNLVLTGSLEDVAGIAELFPLSVTDVVHLLPVGGMYWVAAAAGVAVGLHIYGKQFLPALMPWLFLGVLSAASNRFALFLAPVTGLGIALFWSVLCERQQKALALRLPSLRCKKVVCMVGTLLFLSPIVWHVASSSQRASLFTESSASMLNTISGYAALKTARQPKLFTWWDTGYFAQYVTGLSVFADGGRQEERRLRVLQHIFSSTDATQARNMLRFFAAHGMAGIYNVPAPLSDLALASGSVAFSERLKWLAQLLTNEDTASELLRNKGLPAAYWLPVLYPALDAPVFVYLDEGLLQRTWWFRSKNLLAPYPVSTLRIQQMKAQPGSTLRINGSTLTVATVVTRKDNKVQLTSNGDAQGVVAVSDIEGITLLPQEMLSSLGGTLLLVGSASGFVPLVYEAGVGGIWQVQ